MTTHCAPALGRDGNFGALSPDGSAAIPAIAFLIDVQNGSGTTLALAFFALTGGVWVPAPPNPSSPINPGDAPRYVNAPAQSFSGLGGKLQFAPTTGGTITVAWDWPSGSAPTAAVYTERTSLVARGVLINAGSGQPDFQVSVTPT